jgi:Na+/H+ antiporter NhaD/arsenite permease-like protein
MNQLLISLIFIITYALIISFRKHSLIFLYGSIVLLFFVGMSFKQIFAGIDFNVLGVFLGTMILSELFIYSEVPAFLAEKLIQHTKKTSTAFLAICGLAAFISSFTENIATVFIVAPLAIEICKRVKINPTFLLIGISICSNLQGTATLIGDAASIILATQTGMNFNDFFWMDGKPGVFFAIQFGAIGAFFVLWLFFKKHTQKCESNASHNVKTWVPTILLALMTLNLALDSVLPFHFSLATICLFWAAIAMIWYSFEKAEKISLVKQLDWHTLFFLTGIFILVHALVICGAINVISDTIYNLSLGNPLKAYVIIVLFSVIVSAFVDNIPFIIAMIPVAQTLAAKTGTSATLFTLGLLIGACLGGNITPIGSSSNVVTMGLLRKNNIEFKTSDFVKLGVPFTVISVVMAASFVWVVFA